MDCHDVVTDGHATAPDQTTSGSRVKAEMEGAVRLKCRADVWRVGACGGHTAVYLKCVLQHDFRRFKALSGASEHAVPLHRAACNSTVCERASAELWSGLPW